MMEDNSNYVPWYAMCREILSRFGRRVGYRLARFDPRTGELDLDHLASLIDARSKLVCSTGRRPHGQSGDSPETGKQICLAVDGGATNPPF